MSDPNRKPIDWTAINFEDRALHDAADEYEEHWLSAYKSRPAFCWGYGVAVQHAATALREQAGRIAELEAQLATALEALKKIEEAYRYDEDNLVDAAIGMVMLARQALARHQAAKEPTNG